MRSLLALAVVAALAATTACSHTVNITSDPPGAEVKVDGQRVGTAPVQWSEQAGFGKVYVVEASKPGYRTLRKEVRQDQFNWLALGVAAGGGAAGALGCVGASCIGGFLANLVVPGAGCLLWLGSALAVPILIAPPAVTFFLAGQTAPDQVRLSLEPGAAEPPPPEAPPPAQGY